MLGKGHIAEAARGVPDETGEGRFTQFRKVIGIVPPVFDPDLSILADDGKAVTGFMAINLDGEAGKAVHLDKGLAHRRCRVRNQADNRDVLKPGFRPEMQREARVLAEGRSRPHQGLERCQRHPVVGVVASCRIKSAHLGEAGRVGTTRDRQLDHGLRIAS